MTSQSPSVATIPSGLLSLPNELLSFVTLDLPNRDIKNLRLTCRSLRARVHLRLDRVFLSANWTNIKVFRAIANHDVFRRQVVEIIWDDARLEEPGTKLPVYYSDYDLFDGDEDWFSHGCEKSVSELNRRRGRDVARPDHVAREQELAGQLPTEKSWEYYQGLLLQQRGVLASGADVNTFKFGLEQFPALRRITITPAAHGWLYQPLYDTPMIRAFPYGFNYPVARGWPIVEASSGEASPWNHDDGDDNEAEKNQWRGFRAITRALVEHQQHHRVSELVVTSNQLMTGVNCRIFDEPCPEYHNLVALVQQPGFRRLDLSLLVGMQQYMGWSAFRSGHLRAALASGTDLQHVSLYTDVLHDIAVDGPEPFIPLTTIFPIDRWPRLRHFGLSRFLVMQADVMALLAALPSTVRSVELSFLHFLDGGGRYRTLLEHMRAELGWRDRPATQRPRVSIGIEEQCPVPGRATWVDDEVAEFLYADGPNPFDGGFWQPVQQGKGVVRDTFDPEYERPWADDDTLRKLGYLKEADYGRRLVQ